MSLSVHSSVVIGVPVTYEDFISVETSSAMSCPSHPAVANVDFCPNCGTRLAQTVTNALTPKGTKLVELHNSRTKEGVTLSACTTMKEIACELYLSKVLHVIDPLLHVEDSPDTYALGSLLIETQLEPYRELRSSIAIGDLASVLDKCTNTAKDIGFDSAYLKVRIYNSLDIS